VASSSAGPDLRGIYVISDKSVYRIDLNASSASAIYTASATGLNMNSGCLALDKTAKKIYWIEQPSPGTKKIRRADLDGANAEDFHTFADQTTWYKLIGVDPAAGGKVYWYAYQKGSIYASDKNGSNAVALLASATSYLLSQGRPSLDLANGRIVWMNGSAEKFYYISIAGGTTSDIVSVTTSGATQTANNLVVNPATGKMYWVSYWGASGNGPGDFRMADYPSGLNAKVIDTNGGSGLTSMADYLAFDPVANRVWYFQRDASAVAHLKYAKGDGTGVTATGLGGFNSPMVIYNE